MPCPLSASWTTGCPAPRKKVTKAVKAVGNAVGHTRVEHRSSNLEAADMSVSPLNDYTVRCSLHDSHDDWGSRSERKPVE